MEDNNLTLETLLAIIILMIYTIASALFERYKFHYMHESGLCMIIGVIISLIAMMIDPGSNFTKTLSFNDKIFFTFILPPIIFSAGYNIRRTTFFKYFVYIFSFGVIGTVVTFLVVFPLTYIVNINGLFRLTYASSSIEGIQNETIHERSLIEKLNMNVTSGYSALYVQSSPNMRAYLVNGTNINENNFNISGNEMNNDTDVDKKDEEDSKATVITFSLAEILLFASVISATDTIAALTFIKEDSEPKLFAILFGEGVLNDAVCIVLYRILLDFTSTGQEFTKKTPLIMISSFLNLFIFSLIVGALVGGLCSWCLKKLQNKGIYLNRVQEISVLLFFAFISYTLTEEMGLSPIISLLFSGMFMSNYAFYNLSFQAREESSIVSRILSNIAEAFVFTYLGLTLIYYMTHSLSISFIIIELFIVVLGRIIAIFGLAWFMDFCGIKSFKIKISEKGIMSCAGFIRGAIAFGLAISIETPNKQNQEVLISSTLILVFFTTIVFGALMPFLIKMMKQLDTASANEAKLLEEEEEEPSNQLVHFMHPNFVDKFEGSKETNFEVLKNRISYWLGHYWFEFDDMYIKPRLVNDWPIVRDLNMKLKNVIINAVSKFQDTEFKESMQSSKSKHKASVSQGEKNLSYIELEQIGKKKTDYYSNEKDSFKDKDKDKDKDKERTKENK